MNKIEVAVLEEPINVAARASLAANITQHPIGNMIQLKEVYEKYKLKPAAKTIQFCQDAQHGNPTRHGEYTIAIVGASRRVLAQIRTHHVGIDWTSASLQYQDISDSAEFVVPYEIFEYCKKVQSHYPLSVYNAMCQESKGFYNEMIEDGYSNDTAGYIMNQAARNVLIVTGNAESFNNFIEARSCNRNTVETQYVALLMWKALLQTKDGYIMFGNAGPECTKSYGCLQGRMTCGDPFIMGSADPVKFIDEFIEAKWPLLKGGY